MLVAKEDSGAVMDDSARDETGLVGMSIVERMKLDADALLSAPELERKVS